MVALLTAKLKILIALIAALTTLTSLQHPKLGGVSALQADVTLNSNITTLTNAVSALPTKKPPKIFTSVNLNMPFKYAVTRYTDCDTCDASYWITVETTLNRTKYRKIIGLGAQSAKSVDWTQE